MANFNQGKALRELLLGKKVERDAAAHIGATTAYFHIYTGRVLMTGLVGTVTVASGANSTLWEAVPTTGATKPVTLAADIDTAVVGDSFTIDGVPGDAMQHNATGGGMMLTKGVVLEVGTLNLHCAAADGSSSWTLFYVPIDDGAYVEAV